MGDDIVERLKLNHQMLHLPLVTALDRQLIQKDVSKGAAEIESLRARLDRAERALDRYRYATEWTVADAWDFCSECRERLEWARSLDDRRLDVNEVAAIGKKFHARAAPPEEG